MTEIKELPAGWATAIFDDLLDYIQPTEFIVASTDYDDSYATPVLTPGKSFIIGYTNETTGIFKDLPVIIFDDFTTATKFVNFPFKVKSSAMKILIPTCSLVDIKYAFYFMSTIQMNTDTHKRYWISVYSKKQIPLAPQNEQARIVAKIEELFSEIDKGIESLIAAREQLKVYRQTLLKHAFEGKLTDQWRKDHPDVEPASEVLKRILIERREKWEEAELNSMRAKGKEPKDDNWKKRYKEAELPKKEETFILPETWVWTNLGQVAWSVKDGPHYSPKYSESGIPFISGGNIRPEGIDFSTAKYISEELHQELSERCKPEYGDLLYTKGGTTGIAKINTETREFNVWVHVAVLRLVDSLEKTFLQHILNSPHCYKQSQKYTHGVGNQDLGLTRMVWITFPLPPLDEQREIASLVEEQISKMNEIDKELDLNIKIAANLRQSILTKAFSGQLVPQDPTDEPASMLLERIRAEREAAQQEEKRGVQKKGKRIKEVITMADLMEVLKTKKDWMSAQEAFRRCGIADGSGTDDIEKIYVELRDHIKAKRVTVKRRGNEDWLRIAQGV